MNKSILLSYVRKHWPYFFVGLLLIFFSSSVSISIGKVIGHTVQQINLDGSIRSMLPIFVAVIVALGCSSFFRLSMISIGGERVIRSIRKDLYEMLLNTKLECLSSKYQSVVNTFTNDITILQNFLGSGVSIFLRNFFTLTGSIIILVHTNLELFSYILLIIPVILFLILFLGRKVKRLSKQSRTCIDSISESLNDNLSNIKIIKTFNCQDIFLAKFAESAEKSSSIFIKCTIFRAILVSVIIMTVLSGISFIVFVGINNVATGKISPALLSEFIFYSLLSASSISSLSDVYSDLQQVITTSRRLQDLFESFSIKERFIDGEKTLEEFRSIAFKDVAFSYNDRTVVRDLNFTINHGETVALVGPSGSGKSTIFNLMLNFYDVKSGQILINDTPIQEFSVNQIRRLFSWVPQEANLSVGTIFENISMGRSDASNEEVQEACRMSNILDFINSLPEKFDTRLGKGEKEVSGGQRQRIAIARAVLSDAPVMLFDEATSSLDAESEKLIQDSIKNLKDKKTIVIIAHRLSTIRNADKIIVLENGEIKGVGVHEELMVSNNLYGNMVKLQLRE